MLQEEGNRIEVVVSGLAAGRDAVRAAVSVLSTAERQRADRFLFDADRRRFIVGRARLRQLLGVRLGVAPESIELGAGAHGKPVLASRLSQNGLRFNLSHSGDLAVYAFSAKGEVGVDVETIRVVEGADRIAAGSFSRREHETYCALPPAARPMGFLACWTRKEAFVKALGAGLGHPLDSFDVSLAPHEPARILRVEHRSGENCGWQLRAFIPAPGFIAAVVSEAPS